MKLSPLLAALLFSLLLAACIPQREPAGSLSTPTPSQPVLRVGVDTSLPPFTRTGANGKPAGFEIDLMEQLGRQAGYKVEFVPTDYNQLLIFLSDCRLDAGIAGIIISDDLSKAMEFTRPYYVTGQALVVKKGNVEINGPQDLAGKEVGTQNNSPAEAELDQIPGAQKLEYATYFLAYQDLINGYIDAVISDYPRARVYADASRNNLRIAGEPFGRAEYGVAVCKQKPEARGKIDAALKALVDNGTVDRLLRRWGIKASLE